MVTGVGGTHEGTEPLWTGLHVLPQAPSPGHPNKAKIIQNSTSKAQTPRRAAPDVPAGTPRRSGKHPGRPRTFRQAPPDGPAGTPRRSGRHPPDSPGRPGPTPTGS